MQLKLAVYLYSIVYSVLYWRWQCHTALCGAEAKIEKLSLFFNEKINLRLGLRQGKGEGKVRVKLRRMIVLLFSIELVGKANFPVITHLNTSRQGWQTI